MSKRKNIFLIGPMGAGKTSIGRELAKELAMDFYDSDQLIEERAGADILWIIDLEGTEGFQQREAKVIEELAHKEGIVLATGGGVVAVSSNRAVLAANGIVVYLRASIDDQVERTEKSKKRPLSQEDEARRRALSKFNEQYKELYEELADFIYDTDGRSVRLVAHDIISKLHEMEYL